MRGFFQVFINNVDLPELGNEKRSMEIDQPSNADNAWSLAYM